MKTKPHRVCWKPRAVARPPTCATRKSTGAKAAAETVLRQHPSAVVRVEAARGGRGSYYKLNRRTGKAVRVKAW